MSNRINTVLYYIKNIVNDNKCSACATNWVLDFMEDRSKVLLGVDLKNMWGSISCPEESKQQLDEKLQSERSVLKLKTVLNKKKIKNINTLGYDKQVDSIMELFNIDAKYLPILNFFIQINKNNMLSNGLGFLYQRFSRLGIDPKGVCTLSSICGVKEQFIEKCFNQNNILFTSGILYFTEEDTVKLTPTFEKIATQKISNIDDLKKFLIGNVCKGNKNLKFDHIAQDYVYIQKLLKNAVKSKLKGINILVYGAEGAGKNELVKHIVDSLGFDLYCSNTDKYVEKNKRLNFILNAQAILAHNKKSVLLMDEAEDVFEYDPFSNYSVSKMFLNNLMENNTKPIVWLVNSIKNINRAYIRRFTYCCELKKPAENIKRTMWRNICDQNHLTITDGEVEKYAKAYDVTPGIINTAVRAAKIIGENSIIGKTIDALNTAMTGKKAVSDKDKKVRFNTSLLNTDIDMQVLTEKLLLNKNKRFSLCLYGIGGGGKSLYARYLAEKMGLNIIQKRASDLISKMVGETERNIADAFAEAEATNSILVFDEADSFLRDRTLSNFSWEVTAVNEMLTQMENCSVPFICTTNLMDKIDNASLRRFTFKIKYDYLTIEQVKIAFNDFFHLQQPSGELFNNLNYLTPGDFAVVKNKADILEIDNADELVSMLKQEMSAKKVFKEKRIGFNCC